MKEQSLPRFKFPEEFKEKLVEVVVYKNISAAQVAKKYDLPNIDILINNYKSNLAKGSLTLVPMEKLKTSDTVLLKKCIKDLEKA
ncbi:hypothetical protein ACFX5U_09580 [Sphingobacterium sp. SG20118]|uniref:hypothetical protein n=1 Tax=Sphingobacterium sp. SG20118 TaxID=3367156 RepID=UPI0037DFC0E2